MEYSVLKEQMKGYECGWSYASGSKQIALNAAALFKKINTMAR
jgi:hypothetical protein